MFGVVTTTVLKDELEIRENVLFHSDVVMSVGPMVKDEIRDSLTVEKNHGESADTEIADRMEKVLNVRRGRGWTMRFPSRMGPRMHPTRSREVQNLLGNMSNMATRILNNSLPLAPTS
jgi:hypothetical protein